MNVPCGQPVIKRLSPVQKEREKRPGFVKTAARRIKGAEEWEITALVFF